MSQILPRASKSEYAHGNTDRAQRKTKIEQVPERVRGTNFIKIAKQAEQSRSFTDGGEGGFCRHHIPANAGELLKPVAAICGRGIGRTGALREDKRRAPITRWKPGRRNLSTNRISQVSAPHKFGNISDTKLTGCHMSHTESKD